jgi:hypothetical protein
VVAIIAILISMCVPSLMQANETALTVTCAFRLKQWGTVFQLYAESNEGYYPHIDGLDRDGGPADLCGWIDVLPPLINEKPWRDHSIWNFPGRGTFFQCPSARLGPEDAYDYRPRRNGYFSYAMNSCLELDRNCWPPYDHKGWPMPSFLDTQLIVKPYRVILLFDQLLDPGLGYDGKAEYGSAGEHCGSYPKSFSERHVHQSDSKLGGSVLFCDYHVEWKKSVWKSEWPDDLEVPPRDDPDWYPYPM